MGSDLEALCEGIRSWNGTLDAAQALRKRVTALETPRGKGETPDQRALFAIWSAYAKKRPERLLVDPETEPLEARMYGPFLGDRDMGTWPWHDPYSIDDADAVRWLKVLGPHAPADDPDVMAFVRLLHAARRRELWVPASIAYAELACRNEAVLGELRREFERLYPEGLPPSWPSSGLVAPGKSRSKPASSKRPKLDREGAGTEDTAHASRHVIHTLASWAARGGDEALVPGFSAAKLAAMKLPASDADASAVLIGLVELLAGETTRRWVLPHLEARAAEVPADLQGEHALRDAVDVLERQETSESRSLVKAVTSRLLETRWRRLKGAQRIDALWSWLETACWCSRREDSSLASMRAVAGEASVALALKLDGAVPPGARGAVEAALQRIRVVLDPDVFATTEDSERSCAVVELLLLLDRPDLQEMPWPALVGRAFDGRPRPEAHAGVVRQVARSDLVLALGRQLRLPPTVLRHEGVLERDVVLQLIERENDAVAAQVAVQLERLLRQRPPAETKKRAAGEPREERMRLGDAQVRLLWQVFQREPSKRTFKELLRVLRGSGTPLHEVVEAVAKLDTLRRDRDSSPGVVALACSDLARKAAALAGVESPSSRDSSAYRTAERFEDIAGALLRVAAAPTAITKGWLDDHEALLLGRRSGDGGVAGLMAWIGRPLEGAEATWNRFRKAVEALLARVDPSGAEARAPRSSWHSNAEDLDDRGRPPADTPPSKDQCQEIGDALDELRKLSAQLTWPEGDVMRRDLDAVEAWLDVQRERADRSERCSEYVRELVAKGDEAAIRKLVDEDRGMLDDVTNDVLRSVGRFLLDHLMFRKAHVHRERFSNRVQMPAVWTYLAPLLVGVAAGSLLVLDVGTAWNDVMPPERTLGWIFMVLLSYGLSFLLLAGGLAARMAASTETEGGWLGKALSVGKRVLVTYLGTAAIALVVNAIMLLTLEGTEFRRDVPFGCQLVLWTGLALFLGIFLGLIQQGRGLVSEK